VTERLCCTSAGSAGIQSRLLTACALQGMRNGLTLLQRSLDSGKVVDHAGREAGQGPPFDKLRANGQAGREVEADGVTISAARSARGGTAAGYATGMASLRTNTRGKGRPPTQPPLHPCAPLSCR
jgi:hypothetical protein